MATALPGSFGPPVIGESLRFLQDPYAFFKTRYDRYGPVFKTYFAGRKTAALIGPDANRYVLLTNPRNFLNQVGYAFIYPLFGDGLLLLDGDLHDQVRKQVSPAFHARALRSYVDIVQPLLDADIAGWGQRATIAFYPAAHRLIFLMASRLLIGQDTRDEYAKLEAWWRDFGRGAGGALPVNLPFTPYGRALSARRRIDALIAQIITLRRSAPAQRDALDLLIAETDPPLSDDLLIAQVKNLIFAAHETTASAISWLLVELLRHPDCLEQVRAELGPEPLALDDLRGKPFTDACLTEAMRLHPPAGVLIRGVKEVFSFGGFDIPAGWSVMLAPVFVQRMDAYFADPDQFEPSRFLPPRSEDKRSPFAWIGFGGGPRICIGETLARMEIKLLLSAILRRYDLELAPQQDLTPQQIPTARPRGDVLLHLRRRG